MLELDDLGANRQRTLAGAVAAEALDANPKTRLRIHAVHRHLVGVLGGGHAHGFELGGNVGRGVGLFDRAAHATFPFGMAERHEVFGKGSCLGCVVVDEVVLVVRCESKPGRTEHEDGGDHENNHANRHQGLRSKHFRTSPPGHVFFG